MKPGRIENNALLRTLASKKAQNFATKRLIKDLKDFELNRVPTVNVAAHPLPEDLFVWHANLLGPEGTVYDGLMLHFELTIPENYPLSAPSIKCFNFDIPHPNIFGQKLCVDILEAPTPQQPGTGWTSAYTIQSILLQLQSFLIEGDIAYRNDPEKRNQILKNIEKCNTFRCYTRGCKHGGKLSAWPAPLTLKEFKPDKDFQIEATDLELYEEGLKCFHTKKTWRENQLGVGLKITRISRTGGINQCTPMLDYLSLKAFLKEGVRRSTYQETFSHWIPLYFAEEQKDQVIHLGKRAFSYICTNSTKRFDYSMALKVLERGFFTIFLRMADLKRHPSILLIQQLLQFHGLFLLFIKEFPQIRVDIEERIKIFIEDPESRNKKCTPQLGLLMVYCLLTEKYTFADIINHYFSEQLDRQVLWILKKIPELEDDTSTIVVDENRIEVTFASTVIGYLLVVFYKDYTDIIKKEYKTWDNLLDSLSSNFCKVDRGIEDQLQHKFIDALENLKSYKQFFSRVGLAQKSNEEMTQLLKSAVANSRRKNYHGDVDDVVGLPSIQQQAKEYLKASTSLMDFIDSEGKLQVATETVWKDRCLKRWTWIEWYLKSDYTKIRSAAEVAKTVDDFDHSLKLSISELPDSRDTYTNRGKSIFEGSLQKPITIADYKDNFTWEELYIKMDIEESTRFINYEQDFISLYTKIDAIAEKLTTLTLFIVPTNYLKSGYYYLCSILSKLSNLRCLTLKPCEVDTLSYKALNNLRKGMTNLKKNGCKIEKITVRDTTFQMKREASEAIYQFFEDIPTLESLIISNTNILEAKENRLIGIFLTNNTQIRELTINDGIKNEKIGKSLADGLMRTKKMEIIDLRNNRCAGNSINTILYNLAFSPKIRYLDICDTNSTVCELVENVSKILSISGSIECLIMDRIPNLFSNFTRDFFKALGDNSTLSTLSINDSGLISSAYHSQQFANAITLNAKRKGSLKTLLMRNVLQSTINSFCNSLWVSNKIEEEWYGDQTKADRMGGEDIHPSFNCSLEVLDLGGTRLDSIGAFSFDKYEARISEDLPIERRLFTCFPNLKHLNLSCSTFSKNFVEMMKAVYTIGAYPGHVSINEPREVTMKLETLSLSKVGMGKTFSKIFKDSLCKMISLTTLKMNHCRLGVSGAYSINSAISHLTNLKNLDLYGNLIDVDGARDLAKSIKDNSSIEYLEIGYNRIRDEGLKNIVASIKENEKSSLRAIGLTSNFLSDGSFTKLTQEVSSSKISHVFFKKNKITDYCIEGHVENSKKLGEGAYFDIFDKICFSNEYTLQRTVWIDKYTGDLKTLKYFLQNTKECGVIVNMRNRSGKKYPNRSAAGNKFILVEFAHPLSAQKAIMLCNKKENTVSGVTINIRLAGSSTFYFSKDCKVKKSLTNYTIRNTRGGGRGRGRGGRGRGRR